MIAVGLRAGFWVSYSLILKIAFGNGDGTMQGYRVSDGLGHDAALQHHQSAAPAATDRHHQLRRAGGSRGPARIPERLAHCAHASFFE